MRTHGRVGVAERDTLRNRKRTVGLGAGTYLSAMPANRPARIRTAWSAA